MGWALGLLAKMQMEILVPQIMVCRFESGFCCLFWLPATLGGSSEGSNSWVLVTPPGIEFLTQSWLLWAFVEGTSGWEVCFSKNGK